MFDQRIVALMFLINSVKMESLVCSVCSNGVSSVVSYTVCPYLLYPPFTLL